MQPCSACRVIRAGSDFVPTELRGLPSIYSPPQAGPDLGRLQISHRDLVESYGSNSAVEARYVNYTALTKDERESAGYSRGGGEQPHVAFSDRRRNRAAQRSANGSPVQDSPSCRRFRESTVAPGSRRCNRLHQEEVGGADPWGRERTLKFRAAFFLILLGRLPGLHADTSPQAMPLWLSPRPIGRPKACDTTAWAGASPTSAAQVNGPMLLPIDSSFHDIGLNPYQAWTVDRQKHRAVDLAALVDSLQPRLSYRSLRLSDGRGESPQWHSLGRSVRVQPQVNVQENQKKTQL